MFSIAFTNVLTTLLYILPGFAICKLRKATADHLPTLSAVLIYICSPCMIANVFFTLDYSEEILLNMLWFFLLSFFVQAAFMGGIYFLLHKKMQDAKYRVLTIGAVLGNVGFFGLPILKALLPANPEVICYSSMINVSMNLIAFTMGVFCLTGDKRYMTVKAALMNPTMLGYVVGFPVFLLQIAGQIPKELTGCIELLGKMTTPLCMFILGIRLASVKLLPLFTRPIIYVTALCKLVLFPLFAYLCVCFLPLDPSVKASMLILTCVPCAAVMQSLAEMHRSQTELAANCVLVTTLLCFITIPVMTLLL